MHVYRLLDPFFPFLSFPFLLRPYNLNRFLSIFSFISESESEYEFAMLFFIRSDRCYFASLLLSQFEIGSRNSRSLLGAAGCGGNGSSLLSLVDGVGEKKDDERTDYYCVVHFEWLT